MREKTWKNVKKMKTTNQDCVTFTYGVRQSVFLFFKTLFSYAICSHFEEFGMFKLNKLLIFLVWIPHKQRCAPHCTWLSKKKNNFQMIRIPEQKICWTLIVIFHLLEILRNQKESNNKKKSREKTTTNAKCTIWWFPPCDFRSKSMRARTNSLHVWNWAVSSLV